MVWQDLNNLGFYEGELILSDFQPKTKDYATAKLTDE